MIVLIPRYILDEQIPNSLQKIAAVAGI
jgi:hypothetical protein